MELTIDKKKYVLVKRKYGNSCDGCCFDDKYNCTSSSLNHCDYTHIWKEAEEVKDYFTNDQKIHAIESFLKFGKQSFDVNKKSEAGYHGGYFSTGWAAQCLKAHLEELKQKVE